MTNYYVSQSQSGPFTSTLNPGDIAIVGQIDNGAPDVWAFVPLVDLAAGTTIYFTDNGWANTGFRGASATSGGGNEGLTRYIAPANVFAGTVIYSNSAAFTTSGAIAPGGIGNYSSIDFNQSGDQIYAFQNSNLNNPLFNTATMTHLFVFDDTNGFEQATTSQTGDVPPGLTAGVTALSFNFSAATMIALNNDNLPRTKGQWLTYIDNSANYTQTSGTGLTLSIANLPFTGLCESARATIVVNVNPLPTAFTVTGGGVYCAPSDPGVPVGLSGSQTGVNYQLQLNGVNTGAPLAGTNAALSFGNQTAVGTYTVVATNGTTGCKKTMTGSVTVGTFNCTIAITDPCVCKNNATTLDNGQFGETITVNAPSGQTWTVVSAPGLYLAASPAPPSAPFPIPAGTVLTPLGGNQFQITGLHIDALGYTIKVTNGSTMLTIGNSCQYPNPSITSDLSGPFCLYSPVVTLVGNPGDNNIVSQTFTVNGVTSTTFNPGAGVGQYTIVYTVNGGTPKAAGANDPGCIQSVTAFVNVVATPSNLVCNDLVYVSLDASCVAVITPDDILEGDYGCYDDYLVELDETAPFGNGPWVPGVVGVADINHTYQVRVTHKVSGNKCWGNVTIQDKLAPTITCTDVSVSCGITNYSPDYLVNTLGLPAGYPVVTDCQATTLVHSDTWHDLTCNQGFNGHNDLSAYVTRVWTATDASGNSSSCTQYIYFTRKHIGSVLFPADIIVSCSSPNTAPGITGVPYIKDFGLNIGLFPNNTFCELQAAYVDQLLPVCDGTHKILRTWTVVDWCLPTTPYPPTQNPLYYIQVITVMDNQGPVMACPANLTVGTDPFNCCATTDLPDIIISDNCSRIASIAAKVITYDQYTGDQKATFDVGGTLTSFPGNNLWNPDTLAAYGTTPCLPQGTHTVIYTATDDCGNTSTCSFRLTVRDYIPPVAACDQTTTVAIGVDDPFDCYTPDNGCSGAGVTWVKATTFDDGSYDNCSGLKFTIRRMSPYSACIQSLQDCEPSTATAEADSIKFYCCEVGTTQTVILRVYQVDLFGNFINGPDGSPIYNECMIQVEVQDKIKPVCVPPANVTVSCENFDPSLWVYGKPLVADNCCLDTTKVYQGQCGLTHSANFSAFDTVCNRGTIVRTFRTFDCHGLSNQCTQRVIVTYNQNYWIHFPDDKIVTVCDGTGTYGEPSFYGKDCELLGVSYEDQVFTVVPDACFKIERTWTIINWCTYNPNLPCITVPNPSPNATVNHPSNLPGPIVSPCGTTLLGWVPTSVKINSTDATATNYCTFWDANANCYKYKQIIKVIDTKAPVATCPASPVTFCDLTQNDATLWNESYWWDNVIGSHDLCEGPTDLNITGTDLCSGSNIDIRYLLFLDLDGDGIMETVISSTNLPGWNNVNFNNVNNPNFAGGTPRSFDERLVPANQKYGFAIQTLVNGKNKTANVRWNTQQSPGTFTIPELPYGTHKIKWILSDGCGNDAVCEYTFVVKDCKAPTVVCLNGLSVNIMPTGMIQMWASDFLQYGSDNCTPANQLKYGIRRSGTGTGFPVDGNGNPITNVVFTCADLGTQSVELWAIDKAGNADFCETYVIVQDNAGICPSQNAAKVAGVLATEAIAGVENSNVEIAGSSNVVPSFNFVTASDSTGLYHFNGIPLASNSTVTPTKDDDPLNGVTTYDLVLISKHILGIQPLGSPYKMIAADANKSGSITTFDIVELRKLILGIYTTLPNNTSWRFVDKAYTFPNPNNPFTSAFPENKDIVSLTSNLNGQDFVSVKIGDVNETAIANATQHAQDRAAGSLLFDVDEQQVKAGEEITVHFRASEKVLGYQFTINLSGLEALDVMPGEGMKAENFGAFGDAITTSFDGPVQGEFSVKFRATKSGKLSEMLGVSSRITKAEAYSAANDQLDVAFRFNQGGVSTISGVGFELYQNQPNPFVNKTYIGFHLPEAATATLTIYDETGRMVFAQKGAYAKGYNSIILDAPFVEKMAQNSVLYYKLETASDHATKKMIQMK
jgi:hypothetical protein